MTDDTNDLIAQLYATSTNEELMRVRRHLNVAIATYFGLWAEFQQRHTPGESAVASAMRELNISDPS